MSCFALKVGTKLGVLEALETAGGRRFVEAVLEKRLDAYAVEWKPQHLKALQQLSKYLYVVRKWSERQPMPYRMTNGRPNMSITI